LYHLRYFLGFFMGDNRGENSSILGCFQRSLSSSFLFCSLDHLEFDFGLYLLRLFLFCLNLNTQSLTLTQKLRAIVIQEVFMVKSLCIHDLDAI
jgi:hypothetical protein